MAPLGRVENFGIPNVFIYHIKLLLIVVLQDRMLIST